MTEALLDRIELAKGLYFRCSLLVIGLILTFSGPTTCAAELDLKPGWATAVLLDGSRRTGPLLEMTGQTVQIGAADTANEPVDFSTEKLLSLELPAKPPGSSSQPALEFANGDRLIAEVVSTDGDLLNVRLGNTALAIPLETLRGIAFQTLDPDDGSAALFLRESGADDLVRLTNGDHLAGRLVAFDADGLILETQGRDQRVPRTRIAAVAFSPELTAPSEIEGERQIVESSSGVLTVRELTRTSDGTWQAMAAFGETVQWPADSVRRIQFAGVRVDFLSEIEPHQIEFVPYFDRVWPVRFDRAVTGEPLSVSGWNVAKGIGVHSRCRITYDLDAAYTALHAVGGLAPSAGEAGSVVFAIEVDGREVLRTDSLSRADPPVRVDNLDLTGAKTLVLEVDFGRNGDVRDRANWCDAVLVRRPAEKNDR